MKIILSTTSNIEEAQKIAQYLVQNKLAACVNIVPKVLSVYEWEDKIQNDEEALMIVKTSDEKAEMVKEKITELHSYTLPEILFVEPTGGSEDYIKWVLNQVL